MDLALKKWAVGEYGETVTIYPVARRSKTFITFAKRTTPHELVLCEVLP